jgi:hypothetical protein
MISEKRIIAKYCHEKVVSKRPEAEEFEWYDDTSEAVHQRPSEPVYNFLH